MTAIAKKTNKLPPTALNTSYTMRKEILLNESFPLMFEHQKKDCSLNSSKETLGSHLKGAFGYISSF